VRARKTSPGIDRCRPLVVTNDVELLDDLLRLAAACEVELNVARDGVAARQYWFDAPLVLIGGPDGPGCAAARLPRRPGVVLVAQGSMAAPDSGLEPFFDPAQLGPPFPLDDADAPAELTEVWRAAADLDAEHVVFLPAAERWLVDRLADSTGGPSGSGLVVGVVGGRGGAGASVLAAGLAVTAARQGVRTLLVDADPLGGGLDLVVGREGSPGLRWPDLAATAGRISAPVLLDALPRVGDVCVLSWDRGDLLTVPPPAVDAALDAGRRGAELVVVDLPRWPDEAAVHALQGTDVVLLVVPAEVRACAAASRIATMIGPHCAQLQCVVRGPAPAGLRSRDLADALGLRLAGVLRPEPGLAAALERGEAPAASGRGHLADLCQRLLADLQHVSWAA
jgi:secretion/DNA translocation related CpaE-like protein